MPRAVRTSSRILIAALLLGSVTPTRAQDGTSAPSTSLSTSAAERSARAEAALARPVERLLTLADGRVLRAEARLREGHWEVEHEGRWMALPPDAVRADELVSRALSEFGARKASLRKAPASERVGLAASALKTGLLKEALQLLDEILADDPDDPSAHALLDLDGLPVAVPAYDLLDPDQAAVRDGLLAYGARAPRTLQELVVRQLQRIPEDERVALLDDLRVALPRRDAGRRAFAVLVLRRMFPGEARDLLVRRAVLDPLEGVRHDAALALRDGGADTETVLVPLVAALGSETGLVRTFAAEALGVVGSPLAVAPLATVLASAAHASAASPGSGWPGPRAFVFAGRQVSYVQDFDPEVATNAVIADPQIGVLQEGAVLDVTVLGVSPMGDGVVDGGPAHEAKAVRGALASLTGLPLRDSNTTWLAWWRDEGEQWLAEHGGAADLVVPSPEG